MGEQQQQPMIYCSACGNQVIASAFVCPKCGTKIAKPGGGGSGIGLGEGESKPRMVYVLLALFLGGFGIHNFYAGRTNKAVVQLILGVVGLLLIVPLIISAIWAIVEAITVKEDGLGRPFI
jgi:TM2 domain-containing membrane protein YozV